MPLLKSYYVFHFHATIKNILLYTFCFYSRISTLMCDTDIANLSDNMLSLFHLILEHHGQSFFTIW